MVEHGPTILPKTLGIDSDEGGVYFYVSHKIPLLIIFFILMSFGINGIFFVLLVFMWMFMGIKMLILEFLSALIGILIFSIIVTLIYLITKLIKKKNGQKIIGRKFNGNR